MMTDGRLHPDDHVAHIAQEQRCHGVADAPSRAAPARPSCRAAGVEEGGDCG
jgi:hypothetical protein